MNPYSAVSLLAILGAGVGLSACTQFEPFQRQGTWHQNQAPMQNIAIELANPADLFRGESHPVLTGNMASTAIDTASASGDGLGTNSGSASSGQGSAGSGSTGGSTGSSSGSGSGGIGGGAGVGGASTGVGGNTGGTSGGAMQ